ncbi:hypothetical protein VHEMI03859 [[Torrubiella] hemipterigena]|uniref:Coiled-coil domain-containing protein 174 n=1 Tax=[Torrubiella] hemipterigena TaxID=1531966 RepID=A0A0A1STQ8_9HYPO|nr:hypothetical protein VHEMI03859 [[Torrubiella] hemipterigena]
MSNIQKTNAPQDPNLYGQRPQKKARKEAALPTSLDFTAQMTSLISKGSDTSSRTGRGRPGRTNKIDIFNNSKSKNTTTGEDQSDALKLKETIGTAEESQELARATRKMEDKARLYAAMKRGDYVPKDKEAAPLVDFDRKWAEKGAGESDAESSSDDDQSDSGEIIEYEDEFGRLRRGTKAEKERMERRQRRGLLGAEELERMSARPSAPGKLIYGDAIQSMAFKADDFEQMEELAKKRDRSATPPEQKHYDADKEIRSKGVGFYKFSKDEETRQREMESLGQERKQTDDVRKTKEDQKALRRLELEQRRNALEARKAKRQADSFLQGLNAPEDT